MFQPPNQKSFPPLSTPLFKEAFIAYTNYSKEWPHSKYYVIKQSNFQTSIEMMEKCQECICEVRVAKGCSYIFVEGEDLRSLFLRKKDSDLVLTQDSIWEMLGQVVAGLKGLRECGCEHVHFKEQSIIQLTPKRYKLLFHPNQTPITHLLKTKPTHWYSYYLSPEQLINNWNKKSIVFSIGGLLLNLMNPLDFGRDIYSKKKYEVDQRVVLEKLGNAALRFSGAIVEIVRKCLVIQPERRLSLDQLQELIMRKSPKKRRLQFSRDIRNQVIEKMSRERERSSSSKSRGIKLSSTKKKKENNIPANKKHQPINQSTTRRLFQETQPLYREEYQDQIQRETKTQQNQQRKLFRQQKHQVSEIDRQERQENDERIINFHRGTFGGHPQFNEEQKKQDQRMPEHYYQQREYQHPKPKTTPILISQQPQQHQYQTQPKTNQEQQRQNQFLPTFPSTTKPSYAIQEPITIQLCLSPLSKLINLIGHPGLWIDGDQFYGQILGGRRNGLGLQIFPEKEYYFGYFVQDVFHGEGFYFWGKDQYFLGCFVDGKKVSGTLISHKTVYRGQFLNNKRHGKGRCEYQNSSIYEGQWLNGKRHGEGTLIETVGFIYKGQFHKGKKHGKGAYHIRNDIITANWNKNKITSTVQIKYHKGGMYVGEIDEISFQKSGVGVYQFGNGGRYEGLFKEDKFVKGKIYYKGGDSYQGGVLNDRRHGFGKYFYNDGEYYEGMWKQGQRCQ